MSHGLPCVCILYSCTVINLLYCSHLGSTGTVNCWRCDDWVMIYYYISYGNELTVLIIWSCYCMKTYNTVEHAVEVVWKTYSIHEFMILINLILLNNKKAKHLFIICPVQTECYVQVWILRFSIIEAPNDSELSVFL